MKYPSICHSLRGDDLDFTYKRVHQAAKLIGYEATPKSVTQNDFVNVEHRSRHLRDDSKSTNNESERCPRNPTQFEKLPYFENINPTLLQNHNRAKSTCGRVAQRTEITNADHRMKENRLDLQRNIHNEEGNVAGHYLDNSNINGLKNNKKSTLIFEHQTQNSFKKSANEHYDNRKYVDGSKWTFSKAIEVDNCHSVKPTHKTTYESDFRPKYGKYCTMEIIPFSNAIGKLSDFQQTQRSFSKKDNAQYLSRHTTREAQQPRKFQYTEPLLFHEQRCSQTEKIPRSKNNVAHDEKFFLCPNENYKKDSARILKCECPPKEHPKTAVSTLPQWSSRLENIDPNLFRRDALAESTQQRVIQGDYTLTAAMKPLSETRESLQKTIDSIPKSIKNEIKTKTVRTSKNKNYYLDMIKTDVGEFPFTKETYMKPSDLQRVIFGDPYLGFGPNLQSVTASDFCPTIETSQLNGPHSWEPKSPCWMKYRKTRSQFADLDCPKRDGIQKFMDEEDGLFRRLYKR